VIAIRRSANLRGFSGNRGAVDGRTKGRVSTSWDGVVLVAGGKKMSKPCRPEARTCAEITAKCEHWLWARRGELTAVSTGRLIGESPFKEIPGGFRLETKTFLAAAFTRNIVREDSQIRDMPCRSMVMYYLRAIICRQYFVSHQSAGLNVGVE
jgi:hypothetical protein